MAERTCPRCNVPLPADAHPQRKYCSQRCKSAVNVASTKIARRPYMEAYRAAHREEAKRYAKTYRQANPSYVSNANRAWYQANKARVYENNRRWRQDNPQAFLDQARNTQSVRRVRKISGDSRVVTRRDWLALCRRFGGRCAYCAERSDLTMDHVVPLSRGGRHAIGNILPACDRCNKSKGGLLLVEWNRRRRAVEAIEAR